LSVGVHLLHQGLRYSVRLRRREGAALCEPAVSILEPVHID
jgi:hypothetical protein